MPQLLPGATRRSVPLAPPSTREDERVIANVAIITNFLAGVCPDSLLSNSLLSSPVNAHDTILPP